MLTVNNPLPLRTHTFIQWEIHGRPSWEEGDADVFEGGKVDDGAVGKGLRDGAVGEGVSGGGRLLPCGRKGQGCCEQWEEGDEMHFCVGWWVVLLVDGVVVD